MKKHFAILTLASVATVLASGCIIISDPESRTYQTCNTAGDCPGETCYTITTSASNGRMCTSLCSGDIDTACDGVGFPDAYCLRIEGDSSALCYQSCAGGGGCPSGNLCVTSVDGEGVMRNICVPNNIAPPADNTYEACVDTANCDAGDTCYAVTTGSSDGAFCSYTCTTDTSCEANDSGAAGGCLTLAGATTAICYQRCDGGLGCPAGNVCLAVDDGAGGSLGDFCFPNNITPPADYTYTGCTDTADCDAGDTCFLIDSGASYGQQCSYTCTSSAECEGIGSFAGACLALGGDPTATCYQECLGDTDCAEGFLCLTVTGGSTTGSVCMPNNVSRPDFTYEICADSTECDVDDTCFMITPSGGTTSGRMCSYTCGGDLDCEGNNGETGACYALLGDGVFICYQRCDGGVGNCPAGHECVPVTVTGGGTDNLCMPNAI